MTNFHDVPRDAKGRIEVRRMRTRWRDFQPLVPREQLAPAIAGERGDKARMKLGKRRVQK